MPPRFESVAIVGTGAIGTYVGARLVAAGQPVRLLMRAGLDEVRARASLVIHGREGTVTAAPVAVFGDSAEMGPADLVIVALKTTSASVTGALLGPLVGKATAILTLQNGLGADEFLGGLFGPERVMGGLAFMAITRRAPGIVDCYHEGSVSLGELQGQPQDRTRAAAEILTASGVKARVVADIMEARWGKLVWNIPFNGLSIVEGAVPTDRICADPRLAEEARGLMLEVQRAAAGFGHRISDEFVRRQFDVTPSMGPYRPSSLVDFMAGRAVEVESIWGEPLRRARSRGIEMPRLARLYERLRACCPVAD